MFEGSLFSLTELELLGMSFYYPPEVSRTIVCCEYSDRILRSRRVGVKVELKVVRDVGIGLIKT